MTGNQLKTIRLKLGLSQGELAVILGHENPTGDYISKVERGERPVAKLVACVMTLLDIVGRVPDSFYEREY